MVANVAANAAAKVSRSYAKAAAKPKLVLKHRMQLPRHGRNGRIACKEWKLKLRMPRPWMEPKFSIRSSH